MQISFPNLANIKYTTSRSHLQVDASHRIRRHAYHLPSAISVGSTLSMCHSVAAAEPVSEPRMHPLQLAYARSDAG
jgi:hypothetical protein